eukprot:TRINITY_DN15966_c1_g2_i1.p1 TRINITY_DN15966_c1_g2~~TRINITY_DN15966_c1_g2_i1.p1  ORF type:complete len:387 (+),score=69.07 TRINITY_DN15966_c1_g2_i1:75-1163(+)
MYGPSGGTASSRWPPARAAPFVDRKAASASSASSRNVHQLLGVCLILLLLICVVPVWNATILMEEPNYVFWHGTSTPKWRLLGGCVFVIVLYLFASMLFVSCFKPQMQSEQSILTLANIFVTMLGLVLYFSSLQLSRQSAETYGNLMRGCEHTEEMRRLHEYSQVLQNIRATPDCASRFSVEECIGYEDAEPYTSMLKGMENRYRCSGFCYRPPASSNLGTLMQPAPLQAAPAVTAAPPAAAAAASVQAPAPAAAPALLQVAESARRAQAHADREGGGRADSQATWYPPTLFSDSNYKAACEGLVARDQRHFVGDIGSQSYYQGFALILIAVATGLIRLLGLCLRGASGAASVDSDARKGWA